MASEPKEPKYNKDGSLSRRGHGEGSRATRYAQDDGRPRPGRRKGARDDKTAVLAIRDMPVRVVTKRDADGQPIAWKIITTRDAIYGKWRELALKGNLKAGDMLDSKFTQYEPPSVDPDLTKDLIEEDKAILDRVRARREATPPPLDVGQTGEPSNGDAIDPETDGDGA